MNLSLFIVSALVSSIFISIFYFLAKKYPEKILCVLNSVMPIFINTYILAICAWVAVGYMMSYIDFDYSALYGGCSSTLKIIMPFIVLVVYGVAFTFLINIVTIDNKNIITLDICIALCADVFFFFHYGDIEHMLIFISFILGKFFWLDNIDLRPKSFCNAVNNIIDTIKLQGLVTTVIYMLVLGFLFYIVVNTQIQFKKENQLGICFGILSGVVPLFLFLTIREQCRKRKIAGGATKGATGQPTSEDSVKDEK